MQITETEFDELPEWQRLALVDLARWELAASRGQAEPVTLNLAQISEAAAIPWGTLHRRYSIALIKLRAQAYELGLDLSDLNP